jgi:hypothetical protein
VVNRPRRVDSDHQFSLFDELGKLGKIAAAAVPEDLLLKRSLLTMLSAVRLLNCIKGHRP